MGGERPIGYQHCTAWQLVCLTLYLVCYIIYSPRYLYRQQTLILGCSQMYCTRAHARATPYVRQKTRYILLTCYIHFLIESSEDEASKYTY